MTPSTRLQTVTFINGRPVESERACISVLDNALLYGEGLFETFLCIDDRLIFREGHLRRLYRGARVTGMKIPVKRDTLIEWLTRAVRRHPDRVKKLRLTVSSGESARWAGKQGTPQVIMTVSSHELPEEPFKLHVSSFRIDQDSVFRRIKTISYGIHAAALRLARQNHCDDALMLNETGKVAEATSANIFWVRKGRVYTPPISSGCLEGVTREFTCREARRLGIEVTEKNETLEQMLTADEVFLSSSLKLVIGVARVDNGPRNYRLTPGPITRDIRNRFLRLVKI